MTFLESVRRVFNTTLFRQTGIFLICFGLIYTLLVTPPNAEITYQYFEMGFEKIIFLICFFSLFMSLKGTWGHALSISATLSLFFLSLIYKWQSADNFFLLGGFFPQSDALGYYADAQRLIHGFDMAGAGIYRPIYSSFLAVLMRMANNNLQLIIIILVTCNALAVYFAAREIRQVLKSNLASALYLILAFMFFRRFSGTLMTENLGFCLGNLAMIFLIRGSFRNSPGQILYGIFTLTIALNARAGAFLVLPVIAIWLGFSFREIRGFWRTFFLGCLVILLGMAANFAIARLTTSSESGTFSNYSYTLYGLASGNKGWEQAGKDHPDADTNQIYSLAIQKIIDNPPFFFLSVLGAYQDYFESSNGAFSFLLLKHDRGDFANPVLWLLTFVGLAAAIINRKQKTFGICLAFFLGILISVSMVPPADSVRMRAYAATIPLSGYIIAAGITLLPNLLKKDNIPDLNTDRDEAYLPFALSVLLLTACLVLPMFIKWIHIPITSDISVPCRENEQVFNGSIVDGSSIRLSPDIRDTYIPDLGISQLAKKIIRPEQQMHEEDKPFFLNLAPRTIITMVGNAIRPAEESPLPSPIFLVTTDLPEEGSHTLCVTPAPVGGFYYTDLNDNQKVVFPVSIGARFGLNGIFRTIQISVLVIVFMVLLVDFSQIHNIPRRKALLALANTVMLGASSVFIMHHFGIVPIVWEQRSLDLNQVRHPDDNNLYMLDIGTNKIGDTKYNDFPVGLYEDGILLEPQHESQSLIEIYGRGGYIIRGNFLFFSTSDNSDPRANGREYILKWPAQARLRYQIIFYGTLLLSLMGRIFIIKPNKNGS